MVLSVLCVTKRCGLITKSFSISGFYLCCAYRRFSISGSLPALCETKKLLYKRCFTCANRQCLAIESNPLWALRSGFSPMIRPLPQCDIVPMYWFCTVIVNHWITELIHWNKLTKKSQWFIQCQSPCTLSPQKYELYRQNEIISMERVSDVK